MSFFELMEEENTNKVTENNSPTFSSSLNKNLDMFALGGAMRTRTEQDIEVMFGEAFEEDKETALRNLVHLRNIRHGGLGERRAFRASMNYLIEKVDADLSNLGMVYELITYLPDLGRWDDVVYVFNKTNRKELKEEISKMIRSQLRYDNIRSKEGEEISLLAKWLPSINTSSKETRRNARELVTFLYGDSEPDSQKNYRKLLSSLRKYLKLVEVSMSHNKWKDVDYNAVPSIASIKYRGAFYRNDTRRYSEYLDGLETGETKVNATVTYPYQIVQAYRSDIFSYKDGIDRLLEGSWKSLPDYIKDSNERAIVVADVSGSMTGTPMDVSVSLAMYCAERLKGEFEGKYITFSTYPKIQTISKDETLLHNLRKIENSEWGMSTDFNKVLNLILNTAKKNNLTQEEVPDKIIVVSDMGFDEANGDWLDGKGRMGETNYQVAKKAFNEAGYKIPQIVFWNVDARANTIPVRKDEVGTALVSGLTPAIFESVLSGDIMNPEKFMMDTLYQEKYDFVKELI